MYTLEHYMSGIKNLTNSLVIKIPEIAMVVNSGVDLYIDQYISTNPDFEQYRPKLDQPEQWKYYLNLAGIPHPLDAPVLIRTIEDEQEHELTAELLKKHPLTLEELLKNGVYYNSLVSEYPNHLRFIHGCMYPVDFNTAYKAAPGTILNYNKTLVEANESYLMIELEKYIKSMVSRWHVSAYTVVDELYLPSFLAYLYSAIYLKIQNLRMSRTHTFQVHSFHLEHFFRSRMDLWDDINVLNKQSIFWLYKNLDNILHNVGKSSTFEKVYNKLFKMNHIGIGEYKLNRTDPKFIKENTDLSRASYTRDPAILKTYPLNSYYLTNNGNTISTDAMIRNEFDRLDDVNKLLPVNFKNYIREQAVVNINKDNYKEEKTKILDIDTNKIMKKTNIDIFSLVMDYWAYVLERDKLVEEKREYPGNVKYDNKEISFVDQELEFVDSDNKIYITTPKVGFLMFLKLLLHAVDRLDIKLTTVEYNRVINTDVEHYENIMNTKLLTDGISYPLLKAFQDILPVEPVKFGSINSFKRYLDDVIDFAKVVWVYMSNSQNFVTSANIRRQFHSILVYGKYRLTDDPKGKTIDQLLLDNNITFKIDSNTDIVKTMKLLFKTFTGVELDQDDILVENLNKYKTILKKLTSYSLQVLGSSSVTNDIAVYYNNPTILKTKHGMVINYGTKLEGLEQPLHEMEANSYDFLDLMYSNQLDFKPQLTLAKLQPVTGDFVLNYSTLRRDGYPTQYASDFITKPVYDFAKYKWFNDFVTVKQMELLALEDEEATIATGSINNEKQQIKVNPVKYEGDVLIKNQIKGQMVVNPGPWLDDVAAYDFATKPFPYFKPDLDEFLKVAGVLADGLEDAYPLSASVYDDSPLSASYRQMLEPNVKYGEPVTGDAVRTDDIILENNTVDFNKPNVFMNTPLLKDGNEFLSLVQPVFKPLEDADNLLNMISIDPSPMYVNTINSKHSRVLYYHPRKGDALLGHDRMLNSGYLVDFTVPNTFVGDDLLKSGKHYITARALELQALEERNADVASLILDTTSPVIVNPVNTQTSRLRLASPIVGESIYSKTLSYPVNYNVSLTKNYEILDLSTYTDNKRYLKIALLGFQPLEEDGSVLKRTTVEMSINAPIYINSKPIVHKNKEVQGLAVYSKEYIESVQTASYTTDLNNDYMNLDRYKPLITTQGIDIEPLESVLSKLDAYDLNTDLPAKVNVFNTQSINSTVDVASPLDGTAIQQPSIVYDKQFITQLAKIPYRVYNPLDDRKPLKISKLQFIGLEDSTGSVDVYSLDQIELLKDKQLKYIPTVALGQETLTGSGVILPVQDNNLELSTTVDLTSKNIKLFDVPLEDGTPMVEHHVPKLPEHNYGITIVPDVAGLDDVEYRNTIDLKGISPDYEFIMFNHTIYRITGYEDRKFYANTEEPFRTGNLFIVPNEPSIVGLGNAKNKTIVIYQGPKQDLIILTGKKYGYSDMGYNKLTRWYKKPILKIGTSHNTNDTLENKIIYQIAEYGVLNQGDTIEIVEPENELKSDLLERYGEEHPWLKDLNIEE